MERSLQMIQPHNDRKRIAKPDLLLLLALLFLGTAGLFAARMLQNQNGAAVRITAGGKVYGTYALSQEKEIPIQAKKGGPVTNVLKISKNQAKMIEADCPDGLCMHQRAVSKQGETIVCLPNEVVVEVTGDEAGALDSVSR